MATLLPWPAAPNPVWNPGLRDWEERGVENPQATLTEGQAYLGLFP